MAMVAPTFDCLARPAGEHGPHGSQRVEPKEEICQGEGRPSLECGEEQIDVEGEDQDLNALPNSSQAWPSDCSLHRSAFTSSLNSFTSSYFLPMATRILPLFIS